jgi:transcription elongation factor Elf1
MPYADRQKRLEYSQRWNKRYYQENKNKEIKRVGSRKSDIGKWFAEYKSGLSCEKCGEREVVCLDFHHISEANKDFNLGHIKSWGWGKERIKKELAKCTVLCANCHRKVHASLI